MCGITGIFDLRAARDVSRPVLQRMNDSQLHRGPDEGSLHIEPGVGFGHRRLSIIDIATGQQPLFNEDGSVVIVFNGEIYNYQELIPELQALGHVFRTKSDTEVIVHAWEAWGEDCVLRLRGMFAFALWDRNRQTFFMARDRLGVKPMYYALLDDGWLLFGSELKSLLAYTGALGGQGALKRDIDPLAVEEYFALGYVAEPRTIFKQALKLSPGHLLSIRRGQPVPPPREYWQLRFTLDNPISAEDACEELRARLDESVRLRMIAEVPLGAFLSGGVDSSAVVASMAGLSSTPVNTCSIGFDDPKFNESAFAQMVADRYRTDHFVQTVKSDDFDLIDTLACLYDEPYADNIAGTDDPLALIQYLDTKTYLVGDINTKVDRASMAHSLEVREPLMDHKLVEWVATLPSDLKIRGQEGKFLLKKAMEPLLPNDVLYRPKMGFSVPLAQWFRGPLKQRVRDAVLGERLASTGWFQRPYLEHLVNAHQSGASDYSAPLWTLLMFEAFLRNVVDVGAADQPMPAGEAVAA